MTYEQLQKEQAEWSLRNFGPHPVEHPLLGMIEELGELAHAHLKGLQGIRHTPEEILAMKKDACADLMIFLADYFTCRNRSMQDKVDFALVELDFGPTTIDNMLYFLAIRDWRKLIAALAAYAESEGFDLHKETFRVWEEVKQRNWRKDVVSEARKFGLEVEKCKELQREMER